MTARETASYRCPRCGRSIRVLADERGDHPCTYCGLEPDDDYGYPAFENEKEDDE